MLILLTRKLVRCSDLVIGKSRSLERSSVDTLSWMYGVVPTLMRSLIALVRSMTMSRQSLRPTHLTPCKRENRQNPKDHTTQQRTRMHTQRKEKKNSLRDLTYGHLLVSLSARITTQRKAKLQGPLSSSVILLLLAITRLALLLRERLSLVTRTLIMNLGVFDRSWSIRRARWQALLET